MKASVANWQLHPVRNASFDFKECEFSSYIVIVSILEQCHNIIGQALEILGVGASILDMKKSMLRLWASIW